MPEEITKMPQRIWLIMTGFSCNNNCVMCSTKPKAEFYSDRPTEEIMKDLVKGRKEGYKRVEFTGGEPTIRPDILSLIKTANDLGYKEIALSTNARMFSYHDFCQKAISNGLNRVTFTINAYNNKLGQAISRTEGSFKQTIQGVKNLLKYSNIPISANTVPMRVNYKHLSQIGKFIRKLGIHVWNILDLIPDGYGEKFYKILSVKITDLSSSLNNLKDVMEHFHSVTFFDFPLCVFSPELRGNPITNFITAEGRVKIGKQTGYQPKRFKKSVNNCYEDIHKERVEVCKKCRFLKSCGGVWKNYLDLYGSREIECLVKKHNCLK